MATIKQIRAVQELGVNGGNISKAMQKAGYSSSAVKRTDKLTQTKGYQQLLDKFLPTRHLLKRHREFLDADRLIRTFRKGDLTTEITETDPSAVKALDIGYKLKGFYTETPETTRPITINIMKLDGATSDQHSAQVQGKTLSITVSPSDGTGNDSSGHSLASKVG